MPPKKILKAKPQRNALFGAVGVVLVGFLAFALMAKDAVDEKTASAPTSTSSSTFIESRPFFLWAMSADEDACPLVPGITMLDSQTGMGDLAALVHARAPLASIVDAVKRAQGSPRVQSFLWKQVAVGEAQVLEDPANEDSRARRDFFARVIVDSGLHLALDEPVTPDGKCHIHLATLAGDSSTVGVLILAGANTTVQDNNNDTPLHIALVRWNEALIKLHGAECPRADFAGAVDTLLSAPDLKAAAMRRDAQGRTALWLAVSSLHFAAVRALLQQDATLINVTDASNVTPLMASTHTARLMIPLSKWITRHGNHLNKARPDADCVLNSLTELRLELPAPVAGAAANNTFSRHAVYKSLLRWNSRFIKTLLQYNPDLFAVDIAGNSVAAYLAYAGIGSVLLNLTTPLLVTPNLRGVYPRDFALMAGFHSLAEKLPPNPAPSPAIPVPVVSQSEEIDANALETDEQVIDTDDSDAAQGAGDEPVADPNLVEHDPIYMEVDDCNVAVVEAHALTFASFRRHFWDHQRPVLLRGAISPESLEQWSWSGLISQFPDQSFQLAKYAALDEAPVTKNDTLLNFLAYAEWEPTTAHSLDEQLRRGALDVLVEARWDHSPELVAAVRRLKAENPVLQWVDAVAAADALPLMLNNFQINVGGLNAGTSPHFHHVSLSAGVHGSRRWFLSPPAESVYDTRQVKLWLENGSKSKHTLPCVQHEGDVLFVPNLWEHAVEYLGPSVGVAYLYSGGSLPI